jgi:hypothetical protein
MRHHHRTTSALLLAVCAVTLTATRARAQQTPAAAAPVQNFSAWMRQEVLNAQQRQVALTAIAENGNGVANQKESPSADTASTSLVDTSSASDFASLALNLSGLRTGEETDKPTSGSLSVTLYSLVAAAKGISLTDPAFYKTGTPWRRVVATVGSEESKPADHFTDKPSTNLGVKVLLINSRDIYSRNGQRELDKMSKTVLDFQMIELRLRDPLQCAIFEATTMAGGGPTNCTPQNQAYVEFQRSALDADWPKTLVALKANEAGLNRVLAIIANLAASRTAATEEVTKAVERIRRGRQLSVAYFTKQREADGTDEHRLALIFDYGLSERLNWTLNASIDHRDRKLLADADIRRFATEFQAKLSNPGGQTWNTRPVTLSGGGEASKDPDSDWLIRAQIKLVVPITVGVDVPVAYTYANRDAEGITSGSQLKLSLAIDPVRLRERFR